MRKERQTRVDGEGERDCNSVHFISQECTGKEIGPRRYAPGPVRRGAGGFGVLHVNVPAFIIFQRKRTNSSRKDPKISLKINDLMMTFFGPAFNFLDNFLSVAFLALLIL